MKVFILCFCALLAVSHGRLRESESRRTLQQDDTSDGEEMMNVIVKYKDTVNRSSARYPMGGILKKRYHRVNAAAFSIPLSEMSALQNDPDVEYVEEDQMLYRSAFESVGYQIPAVQANTTRIPLPDPSADCFNICVIDSGLLIGHPDIPYSVEQGNVRGAEFGLDAGEFWFNPLDGHGTHVTGTMIAESGNNQGIAGVVPGNDGICLLVARAFGDASGGQLGSIITDAIEWCGDNDARLINMSLGGGFSSRTQLTVIQALTLEGVLIVAAAGNDGSEDLNFPASYQQTVSVGAVDRELAWAPFSQNNNRVDLVAPGVEIISTVPSIAIFDDTTGEKYDASLMDGSISIGDALSDTLADCGLGLETCVGVSGSICLVERGEVTFSEKAINCEDGGGVGIIIYNSAGNTGIVTGTLGGVRVGIPVFSLARDSGLDLISSQSVTIDMRSAGYGPKTGTSMATPVVTGVIARIWAARPECTNVQVREAVEKSALDLGESGRDNFYGEGLVQLEAAYTYLLDFDAPCGTGGVTASPTDSPTRTPSVPPTKAPTTKPTPIPTFQPTDAPAQTPASSPVLSTFFAPSQVSTSTRAPVLISQGIFTFSPVSNPQALQQTTPAPATPTFPYASFGAPSSVDAFFANDMDEETIDGSEDMSSSSSMAGLATSAANMSRVRGHFIAASTMMAILLVFG